MKYNVFKAAADTAVRMMLRVPYMMVLYYSMTIYEDSSPDNPTLCVNGVSVWVNPRFWNQLSREQKLTAMVHEVFHKMLLHNSRRRGRDPYMWNVAGDQYINNRLVAMHFAPLQNLTIDGKPWSWICDAKYADPKWTTESIYDDMCKEAEQEHEKRKAQESAAGAGEDPDEAAADESAESGAEEADAGEAESGAEETPRRAGSEEAEKRLGPMHDVRDYGEAPDGSDDPNAEELPEQFEDRVRKELKDAEAEAKRKGNVPGWLERVVGHAFHVKANWYDVLYEHLKDMSKADYSWRRWSKRDFMRTGCIGPDMYQPAMGGVLKFIDTSGSISGSDLAMYDKHMKDVLDQVKPKWVALAYWDTQLHRIDKFERYEYDLDTTLLKPVGGGGTDFTDWQDVIDELEEQPDVVLAYTDMCATFPKELSVPTVWLSTVQQVQGPFGTTIEIN